MILQLQTSLEANDDITNLIILISLKTNGCGYLFIATDFRLSRNKPREDLLEKSQSQNQVISLSAIVVLRTSELWPQICRSGACIIKLCHEVWILNAWQWS